MPFRVPFVNPGVHYLNLKPEIDNVMIDCLTKGDLVYRQQLKDFESQLAEFVGVKYAVGVNSGYHALHFALIGAGIGPQDEVITVGHTFVATVSAIVHCGATPIMVDIDKDFNMDPEKIEGAITLRTKAILPVHLNGRICDMDKLMSIAKRHGLAVIEDAAQALGATFNGQKAGSFGSAGCFSFYPFKILGGVGDGGALTTNDPHIARMASLLRYNGEDRETGEYHYHGYTALLDNIQAAVLSVKLRHLPNWIKHRKHIARIYHEGLEGVSGVKLPKFSEDTQVDVFQNYVIRAIERDALQDHLKKDGIETLIHWRKPMWEHKGLELENPELPETEKLCREVLSLPMSAETTEEDVQVSVQSIRRFANK